MRVPVMTRSIALSIVETLADAENAEPADIEYTLEEYIDTDALRQLAAHETASWTLSFEMSDHEVTVTSDGLILVDGHTEGAWADISASHS